MTIKDDEKLEKSWLLTAIEKRATGIALDPAPEDIAFQHSIFCQTALPYRNPGDDVREGRAARSCSSKQERFYKATVSSTLSACHSALRLG